MSDVFEKQAEETLREYLEAIDKYNQLLGPARKLVPGEKIVFEQWDEKFFKELEEAEAKVTEARKKLRDAWRSFCIDA